jgi:hypothetical protein
LGCPAFAEVFEEKLRTVEIFETSGYSWVIKSSKAFFATTWQTVILHREHYSPRIFSGLKDIDFHTTATLSKQEIRIRSTYHKMIKTRYWNAYYSKVIKTTMRYCQFWSSKRVLIHNIVLFWRGGLPELGYAMENVFRGCH